MSDKWIEDLNKILDHERGGAQFTDLEDDDQAYLLDLRDSCGMTPQEAYDVFCDVEEVE